MREQEILCLPHVVEASFVFLRKGQCLNLAFSWGTFVSSSEICTPPTPHIDVCTLDLGKYTLFCQLLSSSIGIQWPAGEKPVFCSYKL